MLQSIINIIVTINMLIQYYSFMSLQARNHTIERLLQEILYCFSKTLNYSKLHSIVAGTSHHLLDFENPLVCLIFSFDV